MAKRRSDGHWVLESKRQDEADGIGERGRPLERARKYCPRSVYFGLAKAFEIAVPRLSKPNRMFQSILPAACVIGASTLRIVSSNRMHDKRDVSVAFW